MSFIFSSDFKHSKLAASREWLSGLAGLCVLYVITLAAVLLGYRSSAGHLVYGLDDPYIHLSIARNLALHGVWGINDGEFAGASSSPLWTVVLAGSIRLVGPAVGLPLVLNLIALAPAMIACNALLRRFLAPRPAAIAATVTCVSAGVPNLVCSGMEHTLQIALTLWFACECLNITTDSQPTRARSILVAVIAGVLMVATRFEGLFIVFAAGLGMLFHRRAVAAIIIGVAAWIPVLGYSIYSLRHGGAWLPNSVLLKGNSPPHDLVQWFGYLTRAVSVLYVAKPLAAVALADAILLFWIRRDARPGAREIRLLLVTSILATYIHCELAFAAFATRYDAYLIVLGCVAACAAYSLVARDTLDGWHRAARTGLLVLAVAPLFRGLVSYRRAVVGPGNIYRQQIQMARFVHDLAAPVAVNDIGAVSWYGGVYVVDLWGLGSSPVFEAQRTHHFTPALMQSICEQHHVVLALLYEGWYVSFGGLPASWQKIATWTISHNSVAGSAAVSIYSADSTREQAVRQRLYDFSRTQLPSDVLFKPTPD